MSRTTAEIIVGLSQTCVVATGQTVNRSQRVAQGDATKCRARRWCHFARTIEESVEHHEYGYPAALKRGSRVCECKHCSGDYFFRVKQHIAELKEMLDFTAKSSVCVNELLNRYKKQVTRQAAWDMFSIVSAILPDELSAVGSYTSHPFKVLYS